MAQKPAQITGKAARGEQKRDKVAPKKFLKFPMIVSIRDWF
jgi:hypothetical protein